MSNGGIVAANTRFAFKLFAELARRAPTRNTVISPAGISFALALLYAGAGNDARQALARVLQLEQFSADEIDQANRGLLHELQQLDPQVTLAIASSLWVRQGSAIAPEFQRQSEEFYGAEVAELDFDDPSAAEIVNRWVGAKTFGLIPQIVDETDLLNAITILLNAVYFKGVWTFQFDPAQTAERRFTSSNRHQKLHPLMAQDGNFPYYAGEGFQAISLSYGTGRTSMYIFLPSQLSSLEEFYQRLSAASWETWIGQFEPRDGQIALPRLKLASDLQLEAALGALGPKADFDPLQATFERVAGSAPRVGKVRHKAVLEVNEEGTTAAAATAIVFVIGDLDDLIPTPFYMVVDRPFFFAITDNRSGALLFMGAIVEP